MKKYFFLLACINVCAQESKTVWTFISNYSDQFNLMIQTNDGRVHTLKPAKNDTAVTIKLPLIFDWDNHFYKTSLKLGYYNFNDVHDYEVRPFCIEKVVFHLTTNQLETIFDDRGELYLNMDTNLLWKVGTLGWGSCFRITSDSLKTFSSLNYPEHTQLKRDDYVYQMKSN